MISPGLDPPGSVSMLAGKDGQRVLFLMASTTVAGALLGAGIFGVSVFAESGFVSTGLPSIVPNADFLGGYTPQQFWGAMLMLCCLPLSLIPILCATTEMFQLLHGWPVLRSMLHLGLAAASYVVSSQALSQWHGKRLADCFIVGCVFTYDPSFIQKETTLPNGFYPTLAVIAAASSLSFAALQVVLAAASLALHEKKHEAVTTLESPLLNDNVAGNLHLLQRNSLRRRCLSLCWMTLGLLLLPAIFFSATTLLPSTWLEFTKERVAMYGGLDVATEAKDCHLAASTSSAPPLVPLQRFICPEVPHAFLRTKTVQLQAGRPQVLAKIYPDALLFYSFIYSVLLLGAFNTCTPSTSALKRFRCYNGSISIGEAILCLLFFGFLTAFTVHWYHDHNWHAYWPKTLPWVKPPSTAEKTARTAGQVGNFICGLLVLPVTRNSAWLDVFGVSWEHALRYHKALGFTFLFVIALHIVAWWVVYHEQGVFPHDILAVNMFFPLNFHAKPGHCSHLSCLDPEYQHPAADNWTIPLMNLFMLFVGFPVFLFLTHEAVRRANFELFYYSHHCFIVLWFAMLWHASSSWFFLSYGICLWLIDRAIRMLQGLRVVRVETVQVVHKARITMVTVSLQGGRVQPGQYCFLNIPELSQWQWHPFSVASFDLSEDRLRLQFCVKQSGNFTNQLAGAARLYGNDLSVRLEGPYGQPLNVANALNVVLVAGGIGCTPFLSLLTSIRARAAVLDSGPLPAVTLIWVAREHALFEAFAEELTSDAYVTCRLFLSSKEPLREGEKVDDVFDYRSDYHYHESSYRYAYGQERTQMCVGCRPALRYEVEQTMRLVTAPPEKTMVFASGPRQLLDKCSEVASLLGVSIRREDFEL